MFPEQSRLDLGRQIIASLSSSAMDKLSDILKAHVAQDEDTTNKLLGAAFTVVNKDGTQPPRLLQVELIFLTIDRYPLLWHRRSLSDGPLIPSFRHRHLHLDRLSHKDHH